MYNVSIMNLKKTICLQKQKGETPLACILRFRADNPEYKDVPMTYAGRLDPIATGELLVLVGEECKRKEEYLGMDKEYTAAVLLGFQTDSYDILGLPVKVEVLKEEFSEKINSFLGKITQTYPPYSSKTVDGKQLHEYARAGEIDDIELPTKEVEIYSIQDIVMGEISSADLKKEISETIDLVKGDFRQGEIKNNWEEILEEGVGYQLVSFSIRVSSGTYIRSIANSLGGTLLRLHRTKIY
jgi:tRNA pseudouridine55 synthase